MASQQDINIQTVAESKSKSTPIIRKEPEIIANENSIPDKDQNDGKIETPQVEHKKASNKVTFKNKRKNRKNNKKTNTHADKTHWTIQNSHPDDEKHKPLLIPFSAAKTMLEIITAFGERKIRASEFTAVGALHDNLMGYFNELNKSLKA